MARGGKRDVSPATPPGGPGPFSRRTDGQQPLRSGKLGDPGVEFGDVQANLDAQRAVPLPTTAGRGVDVSALPSSARELRRESGPPDFVFGLPSQNASTPVTNGLTRGPGGGPEALDPTLRPDFVQPDDREAVLEYFATHYNNAAARGMLDEMRSQAMPPAPLEPPGLLAPGPAGAGDLEEDLFAGEGALIPGEVTDDMNAEGAALPVAEDVPDEDFDPELEAELAELDEMDAGEEPVVEEEGDIEDAEVVEDADLE